MSQTVFTQEECLWLVRLITRDIAANRETINTIGVEFPSSQLFMRRISNMLMLKEKLIIMGNLE